MGSAFSRAQAMNAKNNASTAILRSALTNYINATKNMNAAAIRAALNNKPIGPFGGMSYKNRIANAVANAVIKARKANVAVADANLGVKPETEAAAAVQQSTTAMNNLNRAIANINTTNFANNAAKESYRTKLMNIVKAKGIALNNARLTAAFNKINAKALKKASNSANQRPANQRPANQRPANQRPANQRPANQRPANQRPANQRQAPTTGNMLKQANNAANNAKRNALQQGKTEQTANSNAAKAAAAAAVANAPPNANANAIRQAAKAATLAAGATPAAANNASKMVTENLNKQKN